MKQHKVHALLNFLLAVGIAGILPLNAPAAPPPSAEPYPESDVDMKLVQVSEHVYYAQGIAGVATDNEGFISNAGVVITPEGIVLFDALGTPSLAQKLYSRIREVSDKPIVKVVISHYHADHFYGLQFFKDMDVEVIAPKGVENYLDSEIARQRLQERRESLAPWVDDTTRLVKPDIVLDEPMDITLGNVTLTLNPLGRNHSHADLTMQVKPDDVLFVGDLVYEQRIPFVAAGDSEQWLITLNRLKLDEIDVIVPGHGAASRNPVAALAATRSYLEYLRATMGRAVEEMVPFDEAYQVDWVNFEDLPAFKAANRRNAYSVYLSMEADSIGTN